MISQADGKPLPDLWVHCISKIDVIRYYQRKATKLPRFWWTMDSGERARILNHLVAVGSIAYANRYDATSLHNYKEGVPTKLPLTIGYGMLYPNPNGGNRMLPSVYCKVRNRWLKANGLTLDPRDMHSDHIENCLNLLKESNGNAVDRSTKTLGRMWLHFCNQPYIQAKLEELCILIQQVDVDHMYPIFTELADELASRKMAMDAETIHMAIDMEDALADWMDTK